MKKPGIGGFMQTHSEFYYLKPNSDLDPFAPLKNPYALTGQIKSGFLKPGFIRMGSMEMLTE